jgi:hypothetical protein
MVDGAVYGGIGHTGRVVSLGYVAVGAKARHMKDVGKLERLITSWHKRVPHLSKSSQKWLASNIWWLALVGVILGSSCVISVMSFTLFVSAALAAIDGVYGAILGGVALVAVVLFLALAIICLVLTAVAITPLKAGRKKGWKLLFMVALLNGVALTISFLSSLNPLGSVWGLFTTIVGLYFLFEIRGFFVIEKTV